MSDAAGTVVLAMPVGLPPSGAQPTAHYADLATRVAVQPAADRVQIWAADDPAWADLFAMGKGLLRYYAAGSTGPDGSALTTPLLALKLWLWEYLEMRRTAGSSSSVATVVCYGNVDAAAVESAIDAELAANERYAAMSSDDRTKIKTDFMAGTIRIMVAGGTRIGQGTADPAPPAPAAPGWKRVDLRFLDHDGAASDPLVSIDLWGAVSGPLVAGHPLLAMLRRPVAPTLIPVEGGTRLRIVGTGLVAGTTVQVGGSNGQDVVVDAAGQIAWATAPSGAAGAADVTITAPGSAPVTHVAAVTYVSDVVAAARGVIASLGVVLQETQQRANDLQAAGTLDDEARATLKIALDYARREAPRRIEARASASGGSADDPLIEAAWGDAMPMLAALAAVVDPLIG